MNVWRDNPLATHAPTSEELNEIPKTLKAAKREQRRVNAVFFVFKALPWIVLIGGAVWLWTR